VVNYLDKAPSGLKDKRKFLFQENDMKMYAEFTVTNKPVVLRAFALGENECLCLSQVHDSCCGDKIISPLVVECKQHCLTCGENRIYVATPGTYRFDLEEPNQDAIVTIQEIEKSQLNFEVQTWA